MTRNLFVMRHGEATHNLKHLMSSSVNGAPLTKTGELQAEAAGKAMAKLAHIDYIFCSPLLRTQQTAAIVAKITHVPQTHIIVDDRLREQDFGSFDGKTFDEYISQPQFKTDDDQFLLGAPDGESGKTVLLRVQEFLQSLEKPQYQGKTILVVTHAYPFCHMSKIINGNYGSPETGDWQQFLLP